MQDLESGAIWSATSQPTGNNPENQEVLFSPHKVEFRRWDDGISLHTEITVGPGGIEIRRVTILNDSDRMRKIKLTSYGEVVLAQQATDRRHPAFNKLFIESEYIPQANALLFKRRLRSADEKPVVLVHALVVEPGRKVSGEYESDRAKFLGRGKSSRMPAVMQGGTPAFIRDKRRNARPDLFTGSENRAETAYKNPDHLFDSRSFLAH